MSTLTEGDWVTIKFRTHNDYEYRGNVLFEEDIIYLINAEGWRNGLIMDASEVGNRIRLGTHADCEGKVAVNHTDEFRKTTQKLSEL